MQFVLGNKIYRTRSIGRYLLCPFNQWKDHGSYDVRTGVANERGAAHFHTDPKLSYGLSAPSHTDEKRAFPFPVLFLWDIIFYYHINASTRFQFPSWFAESYYPSFLSRTAREVLFIMVPGAVVVEKAVTWRWCSSGIKKFNVLQFLLFLFFSG